MDGRPPAANESLIDVGDDGGRLDCVRLDGGGAAELETDIGELPREFE